MDDSKISVGAAIARVAAAVGAINKDETNKEQGFKFRSIEAITDKVRPLLALHGVVIVPNVVAFEYSEQISRSGAKGIRCVARMSYEVIGPDGGSVIGGMLGEAVDYGDKSTSKAVQMAFKYFLTELLTIGSGDAEADLHTPDLGMAAATEPAIPLGEVMRRRMNKYKTQLNRATGGDKEVATKLWADILALHGFGPGEAPGTIEELDAIEPDVEKAVAELRPTLDKPEG